MERLTEIEGYGCFVKLQDETLLVAAKLADGRAESENGEICWSVCQVLEPRFCRLVNEALGCHLEANCGDGDA